jgi:hypothetical protein
MQRIFSGVVGLSLESDTSVRVRNVGLQHRRCTIKIAARRKESDFEDAKDYARRARSALDNAAMSAMNCDCQMA